MPLIWRDYCAQEAQVYGQYGADMILALRNGLLADPLVKKGARRKRGLTVIARPAPGVIEKLSGVAEDIATIVPGVVPCTSLQLHHTFGRVLDYPGADEDRQRSAQILSEVVGKLVPKMKALWFTYPRGYVFTRQGIFLQGKTEMPFFQTAQRIIADGRRRGVPLETSIGHVTVARFGRPASPEVARQLVAYLASTPHIVPPKERHEVAEVQVAWFEARAGKIQVIPHTRFVLRPRI